MCVISKWYLLLWRKEQNYSNTTSIKGAYTLCMQSVTTISGSVLSFIIPIYTRYGWIYYHCLAAAASFWIFRSEELVLSFREVDAETIADNTKCVPPDTFLGDNFSNMYQGDAAFGLFGKPCDGTVEIQGLEFNVFICLIQIIFSPTFLIDHELLAIIIKMWIQLQGAWVGYLF